jgi:hypothetical protein
MSASKADMGPRPHARRLYAPPRKTVKTILKKSLARTPNVCIRENSFTRGRQLAMAEFQQTWPEIVEKCGHDLGTSGPARRLVRPAYYRVVDHKLLFLR